MRPPHPLSATLATLAALAACATPAPAPVPAPAPGPAAEATAGAADAPEAGAPDDWWKDAVFYEIFVRSFKDSDGDGVGDLRGIIDALDYLNDGDPATTDDLGVTGLWLMPVNPSPSYHGYDVTDYRDVNAEYGGMKAFDALIAEAHRRGIRVITDFVLNHSSREHPWFESARQGPGADKRDWYLFLPAPNPAWRRPWDGGDVWHRVGEHDYFYGLFWQGMPDLNLANPAVEAEMLDAMRFWLARGVDGFRIDAIKHLFETPDGKLENVPATHAFVKRMRRTLSAEFPRALLLGEVWSGAEEQAAYYMGGEGLHMNFSFELSGKIVSAVVDGVRSDLNAVIDRSQEAFPDRNFEAPFLTNHDMPRIMRLLGGDAARMRLAAALLLASPGTPFVYYGEEIGMQGGAAGADENKRTPMRWSGGPGVGFTSGTAWYPIPGEAPGTDVAAQVADPESLLALYRRLIRLRSDHVALRRGDQRRLEIDAGRGGVAFVRAHGDARVLVVVNLDGAPSKPFVAPVEGAPRVLYQEGLTADIAPAALGGLAVPALAPRGFAWVALD